MTADLQTPFAEAVIDRARPVPPGVISWTGDRPARRFGVYRNNVAGALVEALGVRYPLVKRLVGDEFFRAMTSAYALAHLPRSPVLIHYGIDYPDFIAGFEPARDVAYLSDVARLESAHWQAYHAADEPVLDPARLSAIEPERLPGLTFTFHPAAFVVSSRFPVVSIWETNSRDTEVKPIDLAHGEAALVTRPGLDVEVRRLPAGAAPFLSALKAGDTLGQAATMALEAEPAFDLARNLAGMIAAGPLCAFADAGDER